MYGYVEQEKTRDGENSLKNSRIVDVNPVKNTLSRHVDFSMQDVRIQMPVFRQVESVSEPVMQMAPKYQEKYKHLKAEILKFIKQRGIPGISDLQEADFTWHHIFPQSLLQGNLEANADRLDFIALGPNPRYRIDDPGSSDLDYDYLPMGESDEQPNMTATSAYLHEHKHSGLSPLLGMIPNIILNDETQERKEHLDIDKKWSQWFIPNDKLTDVFGDDLGGELVRFEREYLTFLRKDERQGGQKSAKIMGLPLLSLTREKLGEELHGRIQERYRENPKMYEKSMRRGSMGDALDKAEEEREQIRRYAKINSQAIISSLSPDDIDNLIQAGKVMPEIRIDIARYLSRYGIDGKQAISGLEWTTARDWELPDVKEQLSARVKAMQESKDLDEQFEVRKWILKQKMQGEESDGINRVNKDGAGKLLLSLLKLIEKLQEGEVDLQKQEQQSEKTGKRLTQKDKRQKKAGKKKKSKGKAGKKEEPVVTGKTIPLSEEVWESGRLTKIAELFEKRETQKKEIQELLDSLCMLVEPNDRMLIMHRELYDMVVRYQRENLFYLEDDIMDELGSDILPEYESESEDEPEGLMLSEAAKSLLDEAGNIDIEHEEEIELHRYYNEPTAAQNHLVDIDITGLMVSDLKDSRIRKILAYRAAFLDYYCSLWGIPIKEDQISALNAEIRETVRRKKQAAFSSRTEGKGSSQNREEQKRRERLSFAVSWEINRFTPLPEETQEDYLSRIEKAFKEVSRQRLETIMDLESNPGQGDCLFYALLGESSGEDGIREQITSVRGEIASNIQEVSADELYTLVMESGLQKEFGKLQSMSKVDDKSLKYAINAMTDAERLNIYRLLLNDKGGWGGRREIMTYAAYQRQRILLIEMGHRSVESITVYNGNAAPVITRSPALEVIQQEAQGSLVLVHINGNHWVRARLKGDESG